MSGGVSGGFLGGLYTAATTLLEPAAGPALRILARAEPRAWRAERLGRAPLSAADSWWHAASLGELTALEPVLEEARKRELTGRIAVTVTTPAGRAWAQARWPRETTMAPLDFPRALDRVWTARSPRALILVETELWPNCIRQGLARGARVAVVNARLSDRAWPRTRRWSALVRSGIAGLSAVAARTPLDAERFLTLGARPEAVRVTGNTKHDREPPRESATLPWARSRVWTAGSVRPGEESALLDTFEILRERHPDLRLVLVPRHPERRADLGSVLEARGLRVAVRSRPSASDGEAEVLLADTRGELASFYAASTVIFVGGTLVPVGGHNVMEAAAAGAPIAVGPHHAVIREEVEDLERAGGLRIVHDAADLAAVLDGWLRDPAASETAGRRAADRARASRGASARTVDWLLARGVLPAR